MRSFWVLIHRYAGLLIAGFLFISGLTGAIISWDHELDEWLNPHLTTVTAANAHSAGKRGAARDALDLAAAIEARYPQAQVTYIPLAAEPGHSLAFGVEPRVDAATQRLHSIDFNQVFVDPASAAELGRREWGAVWPISRETLIPFLYKLHYSLHVPEMWGSDRWGIWLLGIIAMIWSLDCFAGFYLTLPARRRGRAPSNEPLSAADALAVDISPVAATSATPPKSWWQRWRPAWQIRWGANAYKLNFDLHRAVSLWTWALLFIVAFTAFSLNLYREVFFPAMTLVSNVTPSPFDLRQPVDAHTPIIAQRDFRQIVEAARIEARRRGWSEPAGAAFYEPQYGIYTVQFFYPEDGHGAGGVGHRALYLDGIDGRILGDSQPWRGSAADVFVQAQFPLHSGRILGLPGRILISAMGLVVAMLSVTGVVIWWKKRAARIRSTINKS